MRICRVDARLAILLVAWPAPVVSFTGAELFDLCFRKGLDGELACTSYVRGLADGMAFETLLAIGPARYCPPPTLTVKEMRRIIETYLKGHTDQLNREAGALAGVALHQAFPCRGTH